MREDHPVIEVRELFGFLGPNGAGKTPTPGDVSLAVVDGGRGGDPPQSATLWAFNRLAR